MEKDWTQNSLGMLDSWKTLKAAEWKRSECGNVGMN